MTWRQCPYAPQARTRAVAALKHAGLHAAIPLVRARVRYGPRGPRAVALWSRLVEPYLAWHWHPFVARASFGRRFGGDTREVLQQHVYYFGEWEPDMTSWVTGALRPGDVCVDVGANIGYFSLLASALVGPSGTVIAIEPSPSAQRRLIENIRRNRAQNVRSVAAAAAEKRKKLPLFAGNETHTGLATLVEDKGAGVESEVAALPLREIVTRDEMERVRLIKIDVEGAEADVVSGLGELWEVARDDLAIVVEVHPEPLRVSGSSVEELITSLAARGFAPSRMEIDYSPEAYLLETRKAPEPVAGPVDRHTHLIFTRDQG